MVQAGKKTSESSAARAEPLRWDVCIVGGGPAGLSAALILGRCRRNVVVFDAGKARNVASRGLHAFLTREGTPPMQLRQMAREELTHYPSVRVEDVEVREVRRTEGGFEVTRWDGVKRASQMLLLATGRDDELPERPGFRELYGRGVYHCAICDAWEHRDQPLVAYGRDADAADTALGLRTWSREVTLVTDGRAELTAAWRQRLAANEVAVREETVERLATGANGFLEGIEFANGERLRCGALFFVSAAPQKSILPERLGCRLDESGGVSCDEHAATGVPGLFVAGNVRCGLHLAITAAAEGALAAVAINRALTELLTGGRGGPGDR